MISSSLSMERWLKLIFLLYLSSLMISCNISPCKSALEEKINAEYFPNNRADCLIKNKIDFSYDSRQDSVKLYSESIEMAFSKCS